MTPQLAPSVGTLVRHSSKTMATTRRNTQRDLPPPRGSDSAAGTSASGADGTPILQPAAQPTRTQLESDRAEAVEARANPQPEPSRTEEAGHVPEDDDEGAKARGLKALNQMHEEL